MQGKQRHDLAGFNNILQKVAEEQNMLPLDDPAMDDWVPAPVVSEYVSEVLNNCKQLVREMDMLDVILQDDLNVKPTIPTGRVEDSTELPDDWDADSDSTELRPPAELTGYGDMSPAALQPPLSSSSSPEMQRHISTSRVPPLRLGRASGPVPSISAASSARRSPAAMRSPGALGLSSPATRLDLQHAVSSGRVPPLQLAQPAGIGLALRLDGSGRKPEIQSAASSSHRKPEPHGDSSHSSAPSSAERGPSSTEQAGSSGGPVPPLRLGRAGGGMVPSLQLASASAEPTLQRTSTNEHVPEMQGRRDSEAVSALRLNSPAGSEPDLSHVENMTQLPVPPLRVGRNSAVVPMLQLAKNSLQGAVEAGAAQKPLQSHPLTNRSEESASSRLIPGQGAEPSPAVIRKAVDEMHGAQARQPRHVMQSVATDDALVAGSSRVVPDEPTPRHMLPSSRPTSRPSSRQHSARPADKLSARRTSKGAIALREGLSARHVYDDEVSHRPSNQVSRDSLGTDSQQLQDPRVSMEYSSRAGSSRVSKTHTGQSSQGDAVEGLKKSRSGMTPAGSSGREGRQRSGKQAAWQTTTRDYSQPGSAPWRPVSQQDSLTGSEQTVSRTTSAQLSARGREAFTDGPRPGPAHTDMLLSMPQRRASPALPSPVKSSLSSPSTSARQHPAQESNTTTHLAKAVADGRVQAERPEPDGAASGHSGRITLRGRPPEESSELLAGDSSPLAGRSWGRERTGQPSGRTKARTTSSLVQTWRGGRPSPERQGSGNSRRQEWQATGRGSPESAVVRRSLDRQQSRVLGSPQSPGQNVRGVMAGRAVKGSTERSALAERSSAQKK